MREPVTIGDQTFIFNDKSGWTDKKTKLPADKGLLPLLDKMSPELEQETPKKKLRIKIDSSVEPVIIAGQKFVYDKNYGWIDAKTKKLAPESLKNVLSFVSPPKTEAEGPPEEDVEETKQKAKEDKAIADILDTTPEVIKSFGVFGQVGLIEKPTEESEKDASRVRKKDDVDVGLNRVIMKMIDHLASIDAVLKQKIVQRKETASNLAAAQREQMIESSSESEGDAQKISDRDMEEIENQNEEKDASPVSKLALAGLAAGAIALMYKPIMSMVKDFSERIGDIGEMFNKALEGINDVFEFIVSPFDSASSLPTENENVSNQDGSTVGDIPQPAALDQQTQIQTPETPQLTQPQQDNSGSPSIAAPLVAGAAALGTAALASRGGVPASRSPTRAPVIAPPIRPTPQSSPVPRPSLMQRATQSVRRFMAPVLRSPVALPLAAAAGAVALGSTLLSNDEPETPPPGSPVPQPNGTPQAPDAQRLDAPTLTGSNGRLDPSSLRSITGGGKLQPAAADAYERMVAAARADGIQWSLTDSYRTYEEQVRLAREKGLYRDGGLAAVPGQSNHGWGTAVDLGGGANRNNTPQNDWLRRNAHRFGFQTIPREPWHWEYKGPGVQVGANAPTIGDHMDSAVAAVEQLTSEGVQAVVSGLKDFIKTDTVLRNPNTETMVNANKIVAAARQKVAMKVEARTTPPPPSPAPAAMAVDRQNANPDRTGTVETIRERDDAVILNQYIQYFNVGRPPVEEPAALP